MDENVCMNCDYNKIWGGNCVYENEENWYIIGYKGSANSRQYKTFVPKLLFICCIMGLICSLLFCSRCIRLAAKVTLICKFAEKSVVFVCKFAEKSVVFVCKFAEKSVAFVCKFPEKSVEFAIKFV